MPKLIQTTLLTERDGYIDSFSALWLSHPGIRIERIKEFIEFSKLLTPRGEHSKIYFEHPRYLAEGFDIEYLKDTALPVDFAGGQFMWPPSMLERAIYDDLIIIEQSPPIASALAKIVSKVKPHGVAIGALVGYAAGGATTGPLLLITVPAGMIICGTAFGIGAGLQSGLADAIPRAIERLFG